MDFGVERLFAIAAALVLVASAATVVADPGGSDRTADALSFDAGVPAEYDFTVPETSRTATVDGQQFDSVQAAVEAAEPGATVVLSGRFTERVVVNTSGVTLTSAPGEFAVIDGRGEGDVLTLNRENATVRRVWVRNSGFDTEDNDAGIWVNSSSARIVDSRVTATTFGVWVDGVDDVTVRNNTIVGREEVTPLSYRGNGIQLWKTEETVVADNRITDARDGIYYSWASEVLGRNNTMWDLRYGVHYMYSDDCRLAGNVAFDNDVGYALMTSENLEIVDNTAVNNTGSSGHGLLLKRIDRTTVRNNSLVGNGNGLFVYNSVENTLAGNLVLDNDVGVHLSAGSVRQQVVDNSFVANRQSVHAVVSHQLAWNATDRGNYWSDAQVVDSDRDGVSEVRYRPAGLAEHLVRTHPQAAVFARSPAFDAVRFAESSVPIIESPGVIDHHPLADSPHDWRHYYGRNRSS
ncbi:nitrous oxide reductase family maturation protein NosD [Halorussus salinisoli]|uniref:nitrous oxide reductase family maturation protein NosD n=1 Tax=Halorussus salinisoli TaxID=2558242 RepID=UPI0010C1BD72|nr:nitrous oxide reductase family maturation protein NosD [Halorussus salinisoli]